MDRDRRSILAALGLALPFGLGSRAAGASAPAGPLPGLRFRPFEEAVRAAFSVVGGPTIEVGGYSGRRVEVGQTDLLHGGVQGCHNDRPFAGFPAGHLRIVRAGCEPGPVVGGVRLYVSTVDVVLTRGRECGEPSRPLDFAALPPAPVLSEAQPDAARTATRNDGLVPTKAARSKPR